MTADYWQYVFCRCWRSTGRRDTLVTRISEMTAEWEGAALPVLTLVLAGLVPVIMLARRSGSKWSQKRLFSGHNTNKLKSPLKLAG